MADPEALHRQLLGEINTQIRVEMGRRYDVWPDPSSVRAGWHSAGCNVGLCEWTTSGLETICDDAGAEHVNEAHGNDGPLAALRALFAALKLHNPVESTSGPFQCVECAAQCHSGSGLSCDYPDAEYPCATVKAIASALGVDSEIIR